MESICPDETLRMRRMNLNGADQIIKDDNHKAFELEETNMKYKSTNITTPGEVIKLFSCSTQLSMKFVLLIILKLLTNANSFLLNIHIAEHENFSANKYKNANYCWHFHIC